MANRFPLTVNPATQAIEELAVGDGLDLSQSNIVNVGNVTVAGGVYSNNYFYANGTPYLNTGFTGSAGTNGFTGSAGTTGLGFRIAKSYATVAALTADTSPTGIVAGEFALIETGNVNDADNSKLYLWSGTAYSYVNDLSGAAGITGPAGSTGFTGSAGTNGFTGSIGFTGSGTGTVSFVASGTIPTGEVVVLKSDGTVSTAIETTSGSFGTSAAIGTTSGDPLFKGVYDPVNQKVVIFYNTGSGMMIVGTVTGNTISFGTASSFTNFSTPFGFAAVYHPGSGKIVTMFGMSNTTRYSIVTVSGTTATASTVTQFRAITATYVDGTLNTASGNIVFVYNDLTNGGTKSVVASTDGTNVTFGTEVTVISGSSPSDVKIVNDANANRVVISAYFGSNAGSLYVGTVSGTSISFGTAVQYLSASAGPTWLSYDSANNQILVVYSKWSDGIIYYKVGTVSGTTITLSAEGTTGFVTRASQSEDFNLTYSSALSRFVIGFRDANDGGKPKLALLTNTTGLITVGAAVYAGNSAGASTVIPPAVNVNDKVIFGWRDSSSTVSSYAVYIPGGTFTRLTNDNYLGISAGSYQSGNTAIVHSAGSVANVSVSGLTIGSVYYVSFSNGALTTSPTTVVAGLAVGSNRILVKQKGDTGFTGSTGSAGFTGSIGFTGSRGITGFTGSAALGGSGLFNTAIDGVVNYAVTSTMANVIVLPSNSLVHSIYVTNINTTGANAVAVSANVRLSNGTSVIMANQLPMVFRGAVELLKKPKYFSAGDAVQLQAFSAGVGANSMLHSTVVYESVTSTDYIGQATNILAPDTATDAYVSTGFPSVIESVMIVNDAAVGNIAVTVTVTDASNAIQGYWASGILIPPNSTIELCENTRRIASGHKIRITAAGSDTISSFVAGRRITT